MISIDPKVSKDANGKTKSVTLTAKDWDQVLDELEELDDIRAFDEALADDSPSIPFEEAIAEIEQGSVVRSVHWQMIQGPMVLES